MHVQAVLLAEIHIEEWIKCGRAATVSLQLLGKRARKDVPVPDMERLLDGWNMVRMS
jgi:hypothetical protein